jgi:ubiquinone/menaquinone biosynthesis C-methylase UbiE
MEGFREINKRAWDSRAEREDLYTEMASAEDLRQPMKVIDACGWLGDVRGKKVLALACGGGRQGILFAAAGADVTVVDISSKQLERDTAAARKHGFKLRTVQASMDDLSALPHDFFDIVVQPVSTCYLPNIRAVYDQVAAVIQKGGLYVSQHKQPTILQLEQQASHYVLAEPYYRSGPLPEVSGKWLHRESGTVEFLHRWDELLGELCRAGFVIENIAEPRHGDPAGAFGTFQHRTLFAPPFIKIKARRIEGGQSSGPRLWIP